ncbi:hypothetical protein HY632_00020 [Candidatus Uhrbacteria bacterium]|nr:hypothetical protein [Candidatus Uhrbacteria bacterium]
MSTEETPTCVRVAELDWALAENGEWRTIVDGRFIAAVWKFLFGRHECTVRVRYPQSRDFKNDRIVRIDCPGHMDRDAAMAQAAAWISRYQRTGAMDPAALIAECIARDPKRFTSADDVIEHAVFRGADGGFTWLDGALVPTDLRWGSADFAPDATWTAQRAVAPPRPEALAEIDNTGNLFQVPDDVRPEWLTFVATIARSFRDRGLLPPEIRGEERTILMRNQELGIIAHRELVERFASLRSVT